MIDERYHVRTPEGADLALTPAGPLPRAAAWLLDMLLRAGLYLILSFLLAMLGKVGMGLLLLGVFLLEWFYPVLFEAFWHGQTPGKRVMGIAVVHADGAPLSFNGSLIRNLLRVADFFPFAYLTGVITMLISPRFQRLGDLAADTLVVHLAETREADAETAMAARAEVPDWPLTLADQQTLIGFAERAGRLTPSRRHELARQAFPELTGERAEARLRGLAHRLMGDS